MKIAIIGSGISGLSTAHLLYQRHDITIFEADSRIGGHTNTIDVDGMAIDRGCKPEPTKRLSLVNSGCQTAN